MRPTLFAFAVSALAVPTVLSAQSNPAPRPPTADQANARAQPAPPTTTVTTTPARPATATVVTTPATPARTTVTTTYPGNLQPPPASALNKTYPVCTRTLQDSCRNPGEGGASNGR
jgi:hypothetical protein